MIYADAGCCLTDPKRPGQPDGRIKKTPRTKSYGLFGVKCLNSAYAVPLSHIGICMPFSVLRQTSYDELPADGGRLFCQKRKLR